jgi:anhydro-N-acetylmuramic acid kinase
MVYRAIGVWNNQNGSTIVISEFLENAGLWSFEIKANENRASGHIEFGNWINQFIEKNDLKFKVALISIHSYHAEKIINGAAIAAETNLPVITDLSAMDIALGGTGDFFISAALKLQLTSDRFTDLEEAVCVAFMGVLRWREEYNFLSSVTGARRNSVGGALWMGQGA